MSEGQRRLFAVVDDASGVQALRQGVDLGDLARLIHGTHARDSARVAHARARGGRRSNWPPAFRTPPSDAAEPRYNSSHKLKFNGPKDSTFFNSVNIVVVVFCFIG